MGMLALSLALTGAPLGGFLMGSCAILVLAWGIHNSLYLARHDLPLLKNGTLVAARISGMVKETTENLYRITYQPPGESTERLGVFAANESTFVDGEPVAIMINPADPAQLVEVSGRYEKLFEKKSSPQEQAAA